LKKYNLNLFIVLIIGRAFDILTTYIAGKGTLAGEMNLLVRYFHFGWTALLFSEVIMLITSFVFLKIQTDFFYFDVEKKFEGKRISFKIYLEFLYYGKKISFLEFFYAKMKLKVMCHSAIHVVLISTTIFSFLIGINNLLAGANCLNLYSFSNSIFYQNNIVKISNFLISIIVIVLYHYNRYKKYLN